MSDKIVPLFLLMVLLACSADYPKEPFTAELWPERSAGIPDSVSFTTLPSRGDGVIRITDIKKPLITVYPAPGTWEPKPAVLIFPGGAYQYMAVNKEGSQIAEWFNRVGITGIVVRYTTPNDREAAFKDAVKALELVHAHASVWNIDPDHGSFRTEQHKISCHGVLVKPSAVFRSQLLVANLLLVTRKS